MKIRNGKTASCLAVLSFCALASASHPCDDDVGDCQCNRPYE